MAHWREFPDTLAPVVAALEAADALQPDLATLYSHLTVAVLSPAARGKLRKIMATHTPFMSKFGRELIEEGRLEGQLEGRLEAKRAALFAVLDARRLAITPVQRESVVACTDAALLDAWIARAATAPRDDDVFGD